MIASFTTDAVRTSQRIEFWQRFVCNHVADIDCRVDGSADFRGVIHTYAFGRMSLSTLAADPHWVGRAKRRINRARNDYFLVIFQSDGTAKYSQNGHDSLLRKGDFVVYEPRLPYEMVLCDRFEHVTLRLPRSALRSVSDSFSQIFGRPVRARTLGGELVGKLLTAIVHRISNLPPRTTYAYAESIVDLIAHAIAQELTDCARQLRPTRGYALAQTKQFILDNLHRENLSLKMISDRIGISTRQINRLFHAEGVSTGQWIKNMRLERCAATLVDSESMATAIGQVAFDTGFSDLSHFCRDFKRHYGLSPGQYRRQFNGMAEQIQPTPEVLDAGTS